MGSGVQPHSAPGLLILEQRAAALLGRETEMSAGLDGRRRKRRRKKKKMKKLKMRGRAEGKECGGGNQMITVFSAERFPTSWRVNFGD